MKKYISLDEFATIISSKESGSIIYNLIKDSIPQENEVTIDMRSIKSMATYCAKQIFGRLYVELGQNIFSKNIIIKNASDNVRLIIQLGIRFAIESEPRY